MRPKVSVYIATSVDGFIARADGGIDWLETVEGGSDDFGYKAFIAQVDALIMGRNTFEKVLSFSTWPYEGTPVTVLSRTLGSEGIPSHLVGKVTRSPLVPRELLENLGREGFGHVYVDGGRTIQSFLREGLVDEMIISRIPVLIGEGRPLFGALTRDVRLVHLDTKFFTNGLVQTHYRVHSGRTS